MCGMTRALIIIYLCICLNTFGEIQEGDTLEKLNYNGEEFTKVHVRKVTPATIEIMHSYGGETIYIHKLDEEIRKKYFPDYNLEKAKEYIAGKRESKKTEAQERKEEILQLLEDNKDKIINVAQLEVVHTVGKSGFLAKPFTWEKNLASKWELAKSDMILITDTLKVSSGQKIPRNLDEKTNENKYKLYEIGTYTYKTGDNDKNTVTKYTFSGKTFIEYIEGKQ